MSVYSKALKCAIENLERCKTRESANKVYKKWECFHKNTRFKKAIQKKQSEFKTIQKYK